MLPATSLDRSGFSATMHSVHDRRRGAAGSIPSGYSAAATFGAGVGVW